MMSSSYFWIQDKPDGYQQYSLINMTKHASQLVLGSTVLLLFDMEFLQTSLKQVWINLSRKTRIETLLLFL